MEAEECLSDTMKVPDNKVPEKNGVTIEAIKNLCLECKIFSFFNSERTCTITGSDEMAISLIHSSP